MDNPEEDHPAGAGHFDSGPGDEAECRPDARATRLAPGASSDPFAENGAQ